MNDIVELAIFTKRWLAAIWSAHILAMGVLLTKGEPWSALFLLIPVGIIANSYFHLQDWIRDNKEGCPQ